VIFDISLQDNKRQGSGKTERCSSGGARGAPAEEREVLQRRSERCSSGGARGAPAEERKSSNLIAKWMNKAKTIIVHKEIVLVQMHFIQRKQFRETMATLHASQQISDLKIFPECSRGPLKTLWRAACGPVVEPHWPRLFVYNGILFEWQTSKHKTDNCYVTQLPFPLAVTAAADKIAKLAKTSGTGAMNNRRRDCQLMVCLTFGELIVFTVSATLGGLLGSFLFYFQKPYFYDQSLLKFAAWIITSVCAEYLLFRMRLLL